MGLLDSIANIIKGYDFSDPVVIKDSTNIKRQIEEMTLFRNEITVKGQELIDVDIKILQAGVYGEDSVMYELRNSHLPILVLRDLQITYQGLEAQIDFMVLSPKAIFIIECKNLIGDIEVNSNGDFIRKFNYGYHTKKEGIYSPITQNHRHLEIIKMIIKDKQNTFISKAFFEKRFENMAYPLVVIANPKSILNIKYAKKEVKEKIIRLDQLNKVIREALNDPESGIYKYEELERLANSLLDLHHVKPFDFKKKYEQYLLPTTNKSIIEVVKEPEIRETIGPKSESIESSPIYQALKKYRLEQSRIENVKPYFIFNNIQLEALVKSAPKNKQELFQVNGFGAVKCEKYGVEILEIINRKI